AIHFIKDRNPGIAWQQKVRMERMTNARIDGARGGDECLSQHLTTEHALEPVFRTCTAKNVLFDGLEIEKGYQLLDRRAFALRFVLPHGICHIGSQNETQARPVSSSERAL